MLEPLPCYRTQAFNNRPEVKFLRSLLQNEQTALLESLL